MKRIGFLKVLGLLFTLVAITALAGFFVGHQMARKQIEVRNDPGSWNEHVSREFDRIVKPTPEQDVKIQASLNRAVRELQEIRADTINRSTNVIWRLISEVEKELNPEQLQAFQQMKPKPSDLTLDLLQVKSPGTAANPGNEKK